jgi:uncharacterized protein
MTDVVGRDFQDPCADRGPWIQTYTGRRFFFKTPEPADIDIVDVAAALSKQPRFGGHCLRFLSVAEHSVLVLREYVRRATSLGLDTSGSIRLRRAALLHDGSEGYLVDLPRPVKHSVPAYGEIEDGVMLAVAERFDFTWPAGKWLKDVDNAVAYREVLDNMTDSWLAREWKHLAPSEEPLHYWSPDQAMAEFLRECRRCEVPF